MLLAGVSWRHIDRCVRIDGVVAGGCLVTPEVIGDHVRQPLLRLLLAGRMWHEKH